MYIDPECIENIKDRIKVKKERILMVFGIRPEAIKMAPILTESVLLVKIGRC
ncbi:MAG: hypothetical protein N2Z80_00295 [Hydrogenothermaceae bacterium]|nr:hypothetical protein [Hydrogenothermaceae bacterium]